MRQRGFIDAGYLAAAAAVGAVLLGGAVWLQTSRLETCQNDRTRLEGEVAVLREANVDMAKKIEEQSAAIGQLERARDAAAKERDEARAKLKPGQARAQERLAELDQAKGKAGSCEAAVLQIRKALRP